MIEIIPGIRASAIILKNKKILLIHRKKDGEEYWVLPGGEVEKGESGELAVIREVQEETGLVALNPKLAFEQEAYEGNGTHLFYVVDVGDGEPNFEGSELERNSQDGRHDPVWVDSGRMGDINLVPEKAKDELIELIKTGGKPVKGPKIGLGRAIASFILQTVLFPVVFVATSIVVVTLFEVFVEEAGSGAEAIVVVLIGPIFIISVLLWRMVVRVLWKTSSSSSSLSSYFIASIPLLVLFMLWGSGALIFTPLIGLWAMYRYDKVNGRKHTSFLVVAVLMYIVFFAGVVWWGGY